MIQILKLQGTDKQLYQLVGPLVMDPNILQYNNGYPFKTGEQFVWYIAIEKHKVAGFLTLNFRKNDHIINNYYTSVIRKGGGYFGADRISCIRPYKDNKNT